MPALRVNLGPQAIRSAARMARALAASAEFAFAQVRRAKTMDDPFDPTRGPIPFPDHSAFTDENREALDAFFKRLPATSAK